MIKLNDNVHILKGKERGKTGKVVRILKSENKVIVDGLNMMKKHQRSRRADGKGQMVDIAMPIHVSNVRLAK